MPTKLFPKKPTSTRRPCPIGLDCELTAAKRGKVCPNRDYCQELTKPWFLPHVITDWPDGTRCLEVFRAYEGAERGSPASEMYLCGWHHARQLPFTYMEYPTWGLTALVVHSGQGGGGWERASDLPDNYFKWAIASMGISFDEFREIEDYSFCVEDYDCAEYYSPPKSDYPHCILPPTH